MLDSTLATAGRVDAAAKVVAEQAKTAIVGASIARSSESKAQDLAVSAQALEAATRQHRDGLLEIADEAVQRKEAAAELVTDATRKLETAMQTLRVMQTRVQDISDHAHVWRSAETKGTPSGQAIPTRSACHGRGRPVEVES